MTEFFSLFFEQIIATSIWEWCAVILAIAYILLAVKESLWCWPAAFVSTAIYAILFFDVNLYMESLLNLYYLVMAIYGWYMWRFKTQGESVKPVVKWSLKVHLLLIAGISLLVFVSGFFLSEYTNQDFAYLDSFTTWFAVVTTYMVAQKVLENWLYWIVIDSISIYLYVQKGFALTAVLFFGYLVIAIFGWLKWKQHYLSYTER
ncbi:nicotinamide riboside transporter PnuC [Aliikangiella coralliicola]|uniref:Nicotinamide riboside transporter PnuC n=1 Tax=Aliikangiella coralliicola TaxID=2592383 RepID=A0A545U7W5_9GAMM|nr:nicotinamide riboside transporter PnuC [Aliikangiella coralliicola]TQV85570.1 nicotinamide mononucleotide transporter [Aliikangiella coralliicola]